MLLLADIYYPYIFLLVRYNFTSLLRGQLSSVFMHLLACLTNLLTPSRQPDLIYNT